MRIYIAAASREVDRVLAAQAAVRARGWTLTFDWLAPFLANLERGVRDTDLSRDEQSRHARADLAAIGRADALWLLAPREPTKGAWWEAGYAQGTGTPIVVSGGCPMIFCATALIVETDAEALDAIAAVLR